MMRLIGIDFDETLAATERNSREAERRFFDLVERSGASPEQVAAVKENMLRIQKGNIRVTGFGVSLGLKSFLDASV